MAKLTLQDIANFQNESTAITTLASNNNVTEIAMENTLSRDGLAPNQMLSNLDLNNYKIINLPNALTDQEPVTYHQLKAAQTVPLGQVIGLDIQAFDPDLDAIAGLTTTGLIARTGAGTATTRTVTGFTNEITVVNGSGVSGNPTISLPTLLTFTGKTINGGIYSSPILTTPSASSPTFSGTVSINSITEFNTLAITTLAGHTTGAAGIVITNDDATKDFFLYAFNSGNASNIGFGTSKNQPISFYTNNTIRMTVSAAGGVGLGTTADPGAGAFLSTADIKSQGATQGIGYATGAGGTVTQATSRTTGVTLNKVSGAITLFSQVNTAVSQATAQSFTVTNSAVAATDSIIVSQKSGTDKYEIFVTNVAAGSFQITNYAVAGTTNEAPVFNFNVIKGVTS